MHAFYILEEIEAMGDKRNDKIALLKTHSNNELLKKIFKAAYDWRITYGITVPFSNKEISDQTFISKSNEEDFFALLDQLAARTLTGSAAKEAWEKFFNPCTKLEKKWYSRILNKDLKVKATDSTMALIWPDLVPKFDCQLAYHYELGSIKPSKKAPWMKFPAIMEGKIDGMRLILRVTKDGISAHSREGLLIDPLQEFVNEKLGWLKDRVGKGWTDGFSIIEEFFIDSEAYAGSWNNTMKLIKTHDLSVEGRSELVFNAFDIYGASEIEESPLSSRRSLLKNLIKNESPNLVILPFKTVNNVDEISTVYEGFLDAGFEGAMIKFLEAPYKRKRCSHWLKYKPVITLDAEIVGSFEGVQGSRLEGILGGFKAKLIDGTEFEVGSGFSDGLRKEYWQERDSLIGKIIEVECQGDKTKVAKVRNPVFKRFREDRTSL